MLNQNAISGGYSTVVKWIGLDGMGMGMSGWVWFPWLSPVAHPKASLLKKTQELEVAFQIVVTDKSLFKNISPYVLLSYLKTSKTKKGFEKPDVLVCLN